PSPVFWTSMPKLPHCPRFIVAGPDFLSTSAGSEAADRMVTRVGSSPPATVGSAAVPLTLGSSLQAKVVPLARRTVAWLVTTVPLAMAGLSVMSNWIRASPLTGRLRLRMSMTPVPLVPPVLLVALMSAPAGDVTSVSVRSEEHTSELQSLAYLVCRLLLEKKK